MKSLQFNVSGPDQHVVFENKDGGLNPRDSMTVEVLCELLGDGEDPTIFSLPAGEKWEAPFVAWRLGFHGQRGVPEFQVTIEGDAEPTTARSQNAVGQYEVVHLAGTYDGSAVRLYVNGKLEAEVAKTGKVLESKQRVTAAARSSTALGGLLVGRLFEMRFWEAARAIEEIDTWKDKSLPLPAPSSLRGLWKAEPGFDSVVAEHLAAQGFSPDRNLALVVRHGLRGRLLDHRARNLDRRCEGAVCSHNSPAGWQDRGWLRRAVRTIAS